jgi:hypothetical protein
MKTRHRVSSIICVLLAGTVIGCISHARRAEALFEAPQSYPSYIVEVVPEPASGVEPSTGIIWVAWGDICITFYKRPLVESDEDLEGYNLQPRLSLSFDGQQIDTPPHGVLTHLNDYTFISYQTLCWDVALEPGLHVVDVSVQASNGEVHTYSWAFGVVPYP